MNDWQIANLGELGDFKNGANFTRSDFGLGYPIINVKNLYDGRYVSINDLDELKPNTLPNPDIVSVQKNDILFARSSVKASGAGQVAMVNEFRPKSIFSGFIIRFRITKNELAEANYLNYLLRSPEYRELLTRIASGTTITNLSQDTLSRLPIRLPPLTEQRAIAGILGALDDKIELNRRMNRTLESMARAVFRELMKDERGKETTIGEVVTVVGGSTPSTANSAFWDGGDIHWATPKDLASLQSPILLDTNSRITKLGLEQISSGLLPAGTVLLSSRAPIGYLAITQIPVAINQGFIAIKCTEEAPNYFILNWLKDNMEEIIGRANGTTFLEISKSNFRPMPIFIPSSEKMKEFVKTVEPMYQKMIVNLKESRTLASLRDALLPKLMRGEVMVKS